MIHDDSTWLGSMCARRRRRSTAAVGLLLACLLFAALPAAASASPPEMIGEWEIVLKTGPQTNIGKVVIRQEANGQGEFASEAGQFQSGSGMFIGTLEGSNATVKITTAAGSLPPSEFNSTKMAVKEGPLTLSGEGTFKVPSLNIEAPGTAVATKIKTLVEVEEREAQEKLEREEKLARENVRGEWSLTIQSGPQVLKGTALITEEANGKNEFASSSALFESAIPGTFSGKLEGSKATVTVTTQAAGPYPEGKFTSSNIAVTSTSNSMSMTGSGEVTFGGPPSSGTLTATRIKTYQEVLQRETAEKQAKEKQEKEEQEAKEKAEREAREKTEAEAKKKREAEEAAKAVKALPLPLPVPLPLPLPLPALTPVTFAGLSTVGHSWLLSLDLTNPNASAVHGSLKLTLAKAGKAAGAKHKAGATTGTLGESSFSIAAHSSEAVKIKLSRSGRTQLAHHKTLRVLVTITTQAAGQANMTKSYTLTLHAPAAGHHDRG